LRLIGPVPSGAFFVPAISFFILYRGYTLDISSIADILSPNATDHGLGPRGWE